MLLDAENALQKLKDGNAAYVAPDRNTGDISHIIREETCAHGQAPYAVVVACSDSRVLPEVIFNAGIGELFDIRVAGNVIGANQLGSIEYAVGHLGTRLVVVLGHDHCGAVGAALEGAGGGSIDAITGEILRAIGGETDEDAAASST
jgi:carbonic anhydrase